MSGLSIQRHPAASLSTVLLSSWDGRLWGQASRPAHRGSCDRQGILNPPSTPWPLETRGCRAGVGGQRSLSRFLPTAPFLRLPPQPSPCCPLSVHPGSKTNRGPQGVRFKNYFLWVNCQQGNGFRESEKGCMGGLITTWMSNRGGKGTAAVTSSRTVPDTRDRPPHLGPPGVKHTYVSNLHRIYIYLTLSMSLGHVWDSEIPPTPPPYIVGSQET